MAPLKTMVYILKTRGELLEFNNISPIPTTHDLTYIYFKLGVCLFLIFILYIVYYIKIGLKLD